MKCSNLLPEPWGRFRHGCYPPVQCIDPSVSAVFPIGLLPLPSKEWPRFSRFLYPTTPAPADPIPEGSLTRASQEPAVGVPHFSHDLGNRELNQSNDVRRRSVAGASNGFSNSHDLHRRSERTRHMVHLFIVLLAGFFSVSFFLPPVVQSATITNASISTYGIYAQDSDPTHASSSVSKSDFGSGIPGATGLVQATAEADLTQDTGRVLAVDAGGTLTIPPQGYLVPRYRCLYGSVGWF